jgi:hypothetical protein
MGTEKDIDHSIFYIQLPAPRRWRASGQATVLPHAVYVVWFLPLEFSGLAKA